MWGATDLAPAWATRRVGNTSLVLESAAALVRTEHELNPPTIFGVRTTRGLLQSLYGAAFTGISVGLRMLFNAVAQHRQGA